MEEFNSRYNNHPDDLDIKTLNRINVKHRDSTEIADENLDFTSEKLKYNQ